MKRIVCSIISILLIASSAAVYAAADEVYSSVIPDTLVLEMCTGGYQSQWIAIKGREQVLDNAPVITAEQIKKFSDIGIDADGKSMSWNEKPNALTVGKFQNSMSVMTFQKNGSNWSNLSYLGAVGFDIKNKTAGEKGYAAVIAKRKWDYSNKMTWGGYTDSTAAIGGNTMLAGFDGYNNVMTWQYSNSSKMNGSYLVVGLMAEKYVDLEKTYFALYITHVSENSIKSRTVIGVPLSRYYSENDKGEYKEVAVPISDFKTGNPWTVSKFVSTDSAMTEPAKIDLKFTGFLGTGLMRVYDAQYADQDDSNKVYLTKQQIVKLAAPSALSAEQADGNTRLKFSLKTGNSINAIEITQKNSQGAVLSRKIAKFGSAEISSLGNDSYAYNLGADAAGGTIYSVKSVAQNIAGNETIGYSDIKSDAAEITLP